MTEDAAPVEDPNMPPDKTPPGETPPVDQDPPATPDSAPANDDTPGIDTAAPEEKTFTETEAKALAQDRINTIIADKYAEKRARVKAEARVTELEGTPAPEQPEPKLEDFDYDESKFHAALAVYHGTKASVDAVSNYKTEQDKKASVDLQNEINAKFDERVVEFRKSASDYDTVVSGLPLIPDDVMDAIMLHENGPKLAHYLGKHLDIAENITLMKLGEISAQLANVKPIKQPSAAPDPIEPVKPGGTLNKNQEDMSMEEIYALPNKR